MSFSRYLAGRNAALLVMAREILGLLDTCDSGEAPARGRASDLMWLWTLGAYEVVRTMCQAQVCFSPRFFRAAAALKVDLERVRVPSTKMERIKYNRRDRSIPVASEREADLWDGQHRDLLVGDPADAVSARMLLGRYARVMSTLTAEDVLASHEVSLGGRQG